MIPVKLAMRVLAIILAPPTAYWWADSSPAIGVDAFKVETSEVPRGGSLKIAYHVNFLRRCSGEGNRYFKDAAGVAIPAEKYEFRDGIGRNGEPVPLDNPQWVTVESVVPVTATPGRADYQNVSDFFCNPLQRFTRRGVQFAYPMIHFTVTSAPPVEAKPSVTLFKPIRPELDLRDRANLLLPSKDQRP